MTEKKRKKECKKNKSLQEMLNNYKTEKWTYYR